MRALHRLVLRSMTKTDKYVRTLAEVDPDQRMLVGGKAANLSALKKAGFPVPAGICLTTEAFHQALAQAGARDDGQTALPIPEDVLGELRLKLPAIIDRPGSALAVRSSATLEDGSERSLAGVFRTSLGVRGEEALVKAIQACWRSFLRYDSERGQAARPGATHSMAVLIQPMIKADCAGVCFSVDPVRGQRDRLLISAAWGLGLGVVEGTIQSDSYRVDRARLRPVERHIVEQKEQIALQDQGGLKTTPVAIDRRRAACLPDAWLRRIAQYAIAAETLFGRAQDLEWAISENEFWLLQSRPITSLPESAGKTPAFPASWPEEQDRLRAWEPYPLAGHEKDALLPLERDCLAALESQREETCRFVGVDRNGRLAFFNGRPFFCSIPINMGQADLRARRQAMTDLRERLREQGLTAWDYWGPEIVKAVRRLGAVDLPAAGGAELADHLEEARAVRGRHFTLHPVMWFKPEAPYFEAFSALSGLTGPEAEAAAFHLVEGEENILTRLVDDLYSLAKIARSSPSISSLINEPAPDGGPDVFDILSGITGRERRPAESFLSQLKSFLATYGDRNGNGYGSVATVCTPTWREQPALVLRLVAAFLDPAVEPPQVTRRRAQREREAQMGTLYEANGEETTIKEFQRQLAYARKAYTVLEEHNHYIDQAGTGQLRQAILAAGAFLAREGVLASRDDVFWLHWEEAIEALRSEATPGLADRIAARKAQHATWQTFEPPPFLGLPQATLPKRPPLGDDVVGRPPAEDGPLKGLGASPGRVRGRARVVHDRLSMPDISPGEILVAPNAGPLWAPLLPVLGGLILDGGSLGQHAAVTAREYGVPAVLATGDATQRIPDGAWVLIDGRAGTVIVEQQA
jgi:phosphohistidine swiveling domain-containing protein